jgi:alpha-ketoglutarate-dependent taurine dioxygenase
VTIPTDVDPRAWRADTLDEPGAWHLALADRSVAALCAAVRTASDSGPVTELRPTDELRGACAADVARVASTLEAGRGFVIVAAGAAGTPVGYWLFGQLLGRPVEQNVQGTLLYDVRDTGQELSAGARFSVTRYESSFHTDNSFGEGVADYVGLLCLQGAKSGGLSQVVSGFAVRDGLLARHRDAWEVLHRPFHVDRRGGVRPGEEPTARVPVFAGEGPDLLVRYLRYWIEIGHEKAGVPLTAGQIAALDTLDCVAADPGLRAEFTLQPGEMLFVNNRWILHNRTAFEDHPEPERRRHYLRLWLARERTQNNG